MKLRKVICIIMILAVTATLAAGCAQDQDPLAGVTPLDFARLMGYGINLGNTMEACNQTNREPKQDPSVYETMWGNPVTTQEMITGMRSAGFKTLRVPVAWTNAIDFENGDFTIDPAYIGRVQEIIDYALNEDMFVIINDHWDHGWWSMFGHPDQAWRDFAHSLFISMWTQIAEHFKDYDLRLIFEPANEEWGHRFNDRTPFSPSGGTLTEDECYTLLTKLSQDFVDLIRSGGGNNPERFLLMKGYNTDVGMTVDERFVLPADPKNKMLLDVHYYTPWGYCGDTSGVGAWGLKSEVEEMNTLLGSLKKFTDMGVGVVIGEWGVLDNGGDDRLTFFTNFLDNCDKYGYVPVLWDTGYTPEYGRLFDRNDTLTIVPEDILELFQSRDIDKRTTDGMTTEDIIATADESMEATLLKSEERKETILSAEEAYAWIMYTNWIIEYSVGDVYKPDHVPLGVTVTDVEVTAGEGTYTVALDFTGTADGYADGFEFAALGIMNGEILFPGYYINITQLLINGEQADYIGIPYTTNDNAVTTRVNLYNAWVSQVPPEARVYDGDIGKASPTFLEKYKAEKIETLEITFDYIAP